MVAEVDVPNPDGALRAGLYVNVDFSIPRQVPTVVIPTEALLFDASGLRVATVDDAGRVHMHNVSVYRDYGTTLELREGLQGGERVALTLPTDVVDGQQVKVVARPEDDKAAAK